MSPRQQAEQIYRKDKRNFSAVVWEHFQEGHVIDKPDCFALLKAVELRDGRPAWMVNVAVGTLRAIVKQMPYPLPFVAWFRRCQVLQTMNNMRVYPLQRFLRKI